METIMIAVKTIFFALVLIMTLSAAIINSQADEPVSTKRKPYTLSVLHILPLTGDEPANGEACRLSSQIVLNIANARSDILPSYHIEMDFETEHIGRLTAMQVIDFSQRTFDDPSVSHSPIMVGPQYSTGCKAISPLLSLVNMVALSTWCTAPFLDDHSRNPNLYLNQATGIARVFAVLRFIHDVGHWNRFGIITNGENINDYGTALFLDDIARRLGYSVSWFSMVPEGPVDEATMHSLKQADVRILVIATCSPPVTTSLLCETYKQGMTGKRYVFIGDSDTSLNPFKLGDLLYPGCTRDMVIEQMKQMYWIGSTVLPSDKDRNKKSHFGYTWPEFEDKLSELTNWTQPGDYSSRYLCHDATLKAVTALEATEKKLNQINLTLRDYERYPELVMGVANESVYHINVAGLRTTGNMSYNSGGKVARDLEMVMHWTPENETQSIAVVTDELTKNGSDIDYDSFHYQPIADTIDNALIDWVPPADSALFQKVQKMIPLTVFVVVILLSLAITIWQTTRVVLVFKQPAMIRPTTTPAIAQQIFPRSKYIGFIGCVFANVAAVIFAVPYANRTTLMCGIALLIMGLTFIHIIPTIRAAIMLNNLRQFTKLSALQAFPLRVTNFAQQNTTQKTSNNTTRKYTANNALKKDDVVKQEIPVKHWTKFDRITSNGSAFFFIVNFIVLVILLAVGEPIQCIQQMQGSAIYLSETDTLLETWITICGIPNRLLYYIIAVVLSHVMLLFSSIVCVYKLGHTKFVINDLSSIRIGVVNEFFLFVLTLAIVALIQNPISQTIAISFAVLLSSAFLTLTL